MNRLIKKGFTIVELLVVVSIISLLMTLLLPALQQAKKTARSAACLGVLRQVGYGLNNYANDFNNWGAASYFLGAVPWITVMAQGTSDNLYGLGYIQWDYNARKGMMICPERTKARVYVHSVDYAVPCSLGNSAHPWRVSPDNTLMKVDTVRMPSCLGWVGDANDYGGDGLWIVRHGKTVNAAFVDLHVEHVLKLPPLIPWGDEMAVNLSANWYNYPLSGNAP